MSQLFIPEDPSVKREQAIEEAVEKAVLIVHRRTGMPINDAGASPLAASVFQALRAGFGA